MRRGSRDTAANRRGSHASNASFASVESGRSDNSGMAFDDYGDAPPLREFQDAQEEFPVEDPPLWTRTMVTAGCRMLIRSRKSRVHRDLAAAVHGWWAAWASERELQKEQALLSKHLELKDAQMTIRNLEEHIAEIGADRQKLLTGAAVPPPAAAAVDELQGMTDLLQHELTKLKEQHQETTEENMRLRREKGEKTMEARARASKALLEEGKKQLLRELGIQTAAKATPLSPRSQRARSHSVPNTEFDEAASTEIARMLQDALNSIDSRSPIKASDETGSVDEPLGDLTSPEIIKLQQQLEGATRRDEAQQMELLRLEKQVTKLSAELDAERKKCIVLDATVGDVHASVSVKEVKNLKKQIVLLEAKLKAELKSNQKAQTFKVCIHMLLLGGLVGVSCQPDPAAVELVRHFECGHLIAGMGRCRVVI